MTSLRFNRQLSEAANEIFKAYHEAFPQGFRIEVDQKGFVDLVNSDGRREPLFVALVREDESK